MTGDGAAKLTTYFGERDRVRNRFLADALVDVYARHALQASLVLRGIEGFGGRHGARTDRLLTSSEDLPLVSVAVDARPKVEAALAEVRGLPRFGGLVTLEGARLWTPGDGEAAPPPPPGAATKATIYVGRHERAAGRPAAAAVVELLHRRGVAGATVLLGIDGTVRGVRRRARFFAGNAAVPVMVIAIGDADRVAGALPELAALVPRAVITQERVHILKRDGVRLAPPPAAPAGGGDRHKVMVFASEQSRHDGQPLHRALVRELRRAGAAGATSLRGIWGYHGDHAPHGDTFWQLRRRVPVVVTLIDEPERMARWLPIVDRVTSTTGLVTSEAVPPLAP